MRSTATAKSSPGAGSGAPVRSSQRLGRRVRNCAASRPFLTVSSRSCRLGKIPLAKHYKFVMNRRPQRLGHTIQVKV
jgi:hypothetical protein